MRLRNKPWAADVLAGCPYYISEPTANAGRWKEEFGTGHPIWLEVGCGKGLYIAGTAPSHPEIDLIGADIKGLMLAYGIRNVDEAFGGAENVRNVRFLSVDAMRISQAFSSPDTVEKIVINFCNPWPKKGDNKKRLIHPRQLTQYREFLTDGGEILFKTDDEELFSIAPEYFGSCGFSIREILYDYYATHDPSEEVLTEHERKFMEQGLPIHYIRAVKEQQT